MFDLRGVMAAAAELQHFCRQQGWEFCLIGGVAVQRWGTPRFTQDVDITLLTGWGSEADFIDTLLGRFQGRLQNARQFALDNRVLLARTDSGIKLDIALGAFPFEEQAIRRASAWQMDQAASLLTCSAEDLIILKVFAGRDRDWGDVESVLIRQHGRLDMTRIRKELPALLEFKDDTNSFNKFERLVLTIEQRLGNRQ